MSIDYDDNLGYEKKILTISDDRLMCSIFLTQDELQSVKRFIESGNDYICVGLSGESKVYWVKDRCLRISIMLNDLESSSVSINLTDDEINSIKLV